MASAPSGDPSSVFLLRLLLPKTAETSLKIYSSAWNHGVSVLGVKGSTGPSLLTKLGLRPVVEYLPSMPKALSMYALPNWGAQYK